ncbi:(d)CMP kinase [Amycolatopsis japonica]|uniref:(d)CMP kinase n=1 Tax=Amycolatopsis japonica TaxID=208439 RepID=UPI00331F7FE2
MPEQGLGTVVAVDGPAAAGKTTTCLALSKSFDLRYLESGRTYRIIHTRLPHDVKKRPSPDG